MYGQRRNFDNGYQEAIGRGWMTAPIAAGGWDGLESDFHVSATGSSAAAPHMDGRSEHCTPSASYSERYGSTAGAGIGHMLGPSGEAAPQKVGHSTTIDDGVYVVAADTEDAEPDGVPATMATEECPVIAGESDPFVVNQPLIYRCGLAYARKVPARCPCCCTCCGLLQTIVIIAVGLIRYPIDVETNFDEFMRTDVHASTMREGFLEALTERSVERRLLGTDLYKHYNVDIAYELSETSPRGSILEPPAMREIAAFENRMRNLPEWVAFCSFVREEFRRLCDPGISYVTYAIPKMNIPKGEIVPNNMSFNGEGSDIIPLSTALKIVEDYGVRPIMMPADFKVSDVHSTRMLRSSYRFKIYCCRTTDPANVQKDFLKDFGERWASFVADVMLPLLQAQSPDKSPNGMRIFYDGDSFASTEVMDTLAKDRTLAVGSLGFVMFYLLVHTRSPLLSIVGILLIALAVPFAYVLFAVISGTTKMSIASFLSLFLIVGLGSDVAFVYTDFWRESKNVKDTVVERVAWTYAQAGKASLATTVTTAVSFFANLASVLKPLREFGFFMGLCVLVVWLLLTLIYVPACIVDEKCAAMCWRCCFGSRLSEMRYRAKRNVEEECGGEERNPDEYAGVERPPEECDDEQRHLDEPQRRSIGNGDLRSACLGWLVGKIQRRKKTCLLVPTLLSLGMCAWAVSVAETETEVPSIFPADHNQNRGKVVMSRFLASSVVFDNDFMPTPEFANICSEREKDIQKCAMCWCEAPIEKPPLEDNECECFRKDSECTDSNTANVQTRIVSPRVSKQELVSAVSNYFIISGGNLSFKTDVESSYTAPMMLEEWESGDVMLSSITEVTASLHRNSGKATCGWQEVCFCNTYTCKIQDPTWIQTSDSPQMNWDGQDGYGGLGSRRLQGNTIVGRVPINMQATVDVVFGLHVAGGSPLIGSRKAKMWKFQVTHEVRQPWAQRDLLRFCRDLPQQLLVTSRTCWIEDFKDAMMRELGRFPVTAPMFDSNVMWFAQTLETGGITAKDYLWIRNDEVKASFMIFKIDVSKTGSSFVALTHMRLWDDYVNKFNEERSRFVRGAWHTSDLWVRAEAQNALISSTVLTLAIVLILAFGGMLVFTRDIVLSILVVFATVAVICGIAWFITACMRWGVGPIEVIALIVFIGYAVTYSLHIAHKYGSDEALFEYVPQHLAGKSAKRYQRTMFAMKSIGGAAIGSAITTAGCAIFLVFCTLTIFQKLGGVVLAVTLMSILTALVPLPAALLLIGPASPGCRSCPGPGDVKETISATKMDIEESISSFQSNASRAYESIPRSLPKVQDVQKRLPKMQVIRSGIGQRERVPAPSPPPASSKEPLRAKGGFATMFRRGGASSSSTTYGNGRAAADAQFVSVDGDIGGVAAAVPVMRPPSTPPLAATPQASPPRSPQQEHLLASPSSSSATGFVGDDALGGSGGGTTFGGCSADGGGSNAAGVITSPSPASSSSCAGALTMPAQDCVPSPSSADSRANVGPSDGGLAGKGNLVGVLRTPSMASEASSKKYSDYSFDIGVETALEPINHTSGSASPKARRASGFEGFGRGMGIGDRDAVVRAGGSIAGPGIGGTAPFRPGGVSLGSPLVGDGRPRGPGLKGGVISR